MPLVNKLAQRKMASYHRQAYLTHLLLICYFATVLVCPTHSTRTTSPQYLPYKPQDFPNGRLYHAYLIIQRFKGTITSDPKNITATWAGNDICGEATYLGFYCDTPLELAKDLTVTAVLFNGFGFKAPKLRGFIDELPDLALFHAASNRFGDSIPLFDSLSYLYGFNVVSEMKTPKKKYIPPRNSAEAGGEFSASPPKMLCVTTFLNFTFNIGAAFGSAGKSGGLLPSATNAKVLLLNSNHLSGPLPTNLGLSKLSYLALANNKLTGPIPSSISHLQDSLFELLLLNNQLSGCLPHELGMLHKAVVIDAGMNQLTGPIPSSFSCLSSVEQLNLAGNRLYGQVPDALCKLAGPTGRLANLTLSSNYFTSVAPACAALIKDGVMDVKNNCIPGLANQRRPAECAAFQMSQQPKTCTAASTQVACPAAAADKGAVAPGERKVAREYSSYVTYATLHE